MDAKVDEVGESSAKDAKGQERTTVVESAM